MKKRQIIILVSLAGLILAGYFLMKFFTFQKTEFARRPAQASERYVQTKPVEYENIRSSVVAKGRVVSSAEIDVVAEASGKIEPGTVSLKKGQSFKKGDILCIIYKDEVELTLKSQKSSFMRTVANLLPDLKIDFPDYYEKFQLFFEAIQLNKDLPALPSIEGEKLKIFLATRNVLSDYYSLKKLEKQLKRHTIYAPFNGSFIYVNSQVGAYTNTGGRIARIIHTDRVEVEIPVENGYVQWIRVGDPVKLASSENKHSWSGKVVRVSDFVDPTTQARPVFVSVPLARQPQLYAGQYLTAQFKGGAIKQVMEIPRNAVFNYNQVYLVKDGLLKKDEIEVIKVNEKTLIFRGLDTGSTLVVQPLINVSENTPVKILEENISKADSLASS